MNTIIYLAADGEVHEGATLHEYFEDATKTCKEYIDEFVNGKHTRTWHLVSVDPIEYELY